MTRGGKEGRAAADPEGEERSRLKNLTFHKNILSRTQAKVGSSAALAPSRTVIKHHGKDILRKSQRKNRYLFSFPGLLGPISGGKIGELKDLGTKNPILYLDFPQGQMKLFGTIVYPKNRYLTLQFSKGGKNVTCDDYFDNMIVFSEAWWIGTKDENPEELQLQFPKELDKEKHAEYDFKGGVGATSAGQQGSEKIAKKSLEREPRTVYMEDDSTDSSNENKESAEVTPTRQSARTARKKFKFVESSSEDDFMGNEDGSPEEEDEKVNNETRRIYTSTETESSCPLVFDNDNADNARQDPAQHKHSEKAKDSSDNGQRSLVQTTLSSLFMKVEEKKVKKHVKKKTTTSEGIQASKCTKDGNKIVGRKSGSVTMKLKKQAGAEEDDIEEFSSSSQDMGGASDDNWTA